MRVKIFSSTSTQREQLAALEAEVNAWLEAAHPHLASFAQTDLGKELVLTFLYEASEETARAVAEATAAVPDAFERGLEPSELDPTADSPLLPEAELPY
jgi:hypothetical protein